MASRTFRVRFFFRTKDEDLITCCVWCYRLVPSFRRRYSSQKLSNTYGVYCPVFEELSILSGQERIFHVLWDLLIRNEYPVIGDEEVNKLIIHIVYTAHRFCSPNA